MSPAGHKLCEQWQWKQANGALRDMVYRGLLFLLDRAGEIELPPARRPSQNRPEGWERPEPVVPDNTPVRGPLYELMPLEFQQVRRTPQEPLFNSLMEQYHYLRYEQPVGEHLKYLVCAKGQAIACLAWSSAVRHLASRDRFIGWSPTLANAICIYWHITAAFDFSLGPGPASGFAHSGAHGKAGAA